MQAPSSVAEALRQTREEHGQDLDTVAEILRIRHAYLEAIESGDFDRLPGATYAVGFLRTYAEFLGLDGDEIVERFKQESRGPGDRPELVFPQPVAARRIPAGAVAFIAVLLFAAAYGGWLYISSEGKSVADLIAPLPERVQAMISGEVPIEAAPVGQEAQIEQATTYTPPEAEGDAPSALPHPADGAGQALPDIAAIDGAEANDTAASSTETPTQSPNREAEADTVDFESEVAGTTAEPGAGTASSEASNTEAARAEIPEPAPAGPTAPSVSETGQAPNAAAAPRATEFADTQPKPSPSVGLPVALASVPPQQTTALALPVPNELPSADPAPEGSPVIAETVIIPSPPPVPQAMAVPTDRSPRVYGENTEGTRIVLHALEDSWVQIRDRQDALLLTRVLRAGDTYFVPERAGLTLLTGNAGGLEIEVDGVKVPPLGPLGAVRRQIALDPTRLLSGTATPR